MCSGRTSQQAGGSVQMRSLTLSLLLLGSTGSTCRAAEPYLKWEVDGHGLSVSSAHTGWSCCLCHGLAQFPGNRLMGWGRLLCTGRGGGHAGAAAPPGWGAAQEAGPQASALPGRPAGPALPGTRNPAHTSRWVHEHVSLVLLSQSCKLWAGCALVPEWSPTYHQHQAAGQGNFCDSSCPSPWTHNCKLS